jgi:hypothetical protein
MCVSMYVCVCLCVSMYVCTCVCVCVCVCVFACVYRVLVGIVDDVVGVNQWWDVEGFERLVESFLPVLCVCVCVCVCVHMCVRVQICVRVHVHLQRCAGRQHIFVHQPRRQRVRQCADYTRVHLKFEFIIKVGKRFFYIG